MGPSSFAYDATTRTMYVLCDDGLANQSVAAIADSSLAVTAHIVLPQQGYFSSWDTVAYDADTARLYAVGVTSACVRRFEREPLCDRSDDQYRRRQRDGHRLRRGLPRGRLLRIARPWSTSGAAPWPSPTRGRAGSSGWTSSTTPALDVGRRGHAHVHAAQSALPQSPRRGVERGLHCHHRPRQRDPHGKPRSGPPGPRLRLRIRSTRGSTYRSTTGSTDYLESIADPTGASSEVLVVPTPLDTIAFLPGSGLIATSGSSTSSVFLVGEAMVTTGPALDRPPASRTSRSGST